MLTESGWGVPRPLFDRHSATSPALWALGPGRLVMVWGGVHSDMRWSELRDGAWGAPQAITDRRLGNGFRASLA
jgi:hypothetical protein